MGRAIVTVHAVHFARRAVGGFRLGVAVGIHGLLAVHVVFHPRNHLARVVGIPVANQDAFAEMRTVDADTVIAAADLHQQHGLGQRVGLILGEFGNDFDTVLAILLWPVAG